MPHAPFAAETLHHEQRNGCTISNGHDAPRSAVSMHHPVRRIQYEHCFYFLLTEDKHPDRMEFPMFMIAAMLPRLDTDDIRIGCSVNRSTDGKNHFVLLRRK